MLKQASARPAAAPTGIGGAPPSPLPPQLAADYPSTLNFYAVPPRDELTLYEFETCALDRLRVLRAIEAARIRGGSGSGGGGGHLQSSSGAPADDGAGKLIEPILSKYLDLKRNTLLKTAGPQVLYNQRRKDHISHFILRLAFCSTEELRQWFVKQETALFRYRFSIEQAAERDAFVRQAQLDLTAVSVDDILATKLEVVGSASSIDPESAAYRDARNRLLADLRKTYAPGGSGSSALAQQLADPIAAKSAVFYRMPFERVCELVARRQVILIGGWAFVPEQERSVLVVNAFREALMANLIATAKALPRLDEDDRLVPVLNSLARQHIENGYHSGGHNGSGSSALDGPVRHEDVDRLSIHFAPCMLNLHQTVRQSGHLKHMGRLQFSLFLKGIGLQIEEALVFWRKAFHRMTDEEFSKKGYAYGIRYNYGLEGRRTNYAPYSCVKIITSMSPGTGDTHGCPFKHFSSDHLSVMLRRMRIADSGVGEVMRMAGGGHYELACTRLYELTRGQVHAMASAAQGSKGSAAAAAAAAAAIAPGEEVRLAEPIGHPNQWFDLSVAGVRGGGPASQANKISSNHKSTVVETATSSSIAPAGLDAGAGGATDLSDVDMAEAVAAVEAEAAVGVAEMETEDTAVARSMDQE